MYGNDSGSLFQSEILSDSRNILSENILAKPEWGCNMVSAPGSPSLPPFPLMPTRSEEAYMKTPKLLLVAVLLAGFAAFAHAGFDDGKAAYGRGDYAEAYEDLKALAGLGDAEAQYFLGRMYDRGLGVAKDQAEAIKWFRRAADQGYAKAQFSMGAAYQTGSGVPQDYVEAVKWFRKAAEQGNAEGQCGLGNMYGEGHGVPLDYEEAVKWCRKAADQGDALAQTALGWAYADGNGVAQDYVQAHMWFSLAAAQGYPSAADYIDTIAKNMTPAQVAEAQRLAGEWKPSSRD